MRQHTYFLIRFISVLLGLVLSAAPQPVFAEASAEMMQWTEGLMAAMIHSPKVTWEQSIFYKEYFRADIAAGGIEKVRDLLLGADGWTLGYLLTVKAQPSICRNNYYAEATMGSFPNGKSFEVLLFEEIMKSNGNLLPGDVLYMAMYLCEADYWLATLTCHNLLKEAAYCSRVGSMAILAHHSDYPDNPDYWYTANPAALIGKLKQLRPPGTPYQDDVAGPWYHIFGLLFVGGVTSSYDARFMASLENITRWLGLGSTTDPFKEEINVWAAHTSGLLNQIVQEDFTIRSKWIERKTPDQLKQELATLELKANELQTGIINLNKLIQMDSNMSEEANRLLDYLRAYQRVVIREIEARNAELARR